MTKFSFSPVADALALTIVTPVVTSGSTTVKTKLGAVALKLGLVELNKLPPLFNKFAAKTVGSYIN